MKINKSMLFLALLAAFTAPVSAFNTAGGIHSIPASGVTPAIHKAVAKLNIATADAVTAQADLAKARAAHAKTPSPATTSNIQDKIAELKQANASVEAQSKSVNDTIKTIHTSERPKSGLKVARTAQSQAKETVSAGSTAIADAKKIIAS